MKRYFLVGLGFLSLIIGIIGIFVPLLPTTPFLILTAFLFNQSSPRFHAWLLNHKYLGPPIVDWQKNRVIRPQAKWFATLVMALSTFWVLTKKNLPLEGKLAYSVFTLILLGFIWSRKSNPR